MTTGLIRRKETDTPGEHQRHGGPNWSDASPEQEPRATQAPSDAERRCGTVLSRTSSRTRPADTLISAFWPAEL